MPTTLHRKDSIKKQYFKKLNNFLQNGSNDIFASPAKFINFVLHISIIFHTFVTT